MNYSAAKAVVLDFMTLFWTWLVSIGPSMHATECLCDAFEIMLSITIETHKEVILGCR